MPRFLQWPWYALIYVALLVLLRLFALPVILLMVVERRKYSPNGVQEGYCLARTRKKLIRLAPGLPLLALAVACFWLSPYAWERRWQDLLTVLALGAVSGLIGLYLTFTALRDACFPEKSKLAASIRSQLPYPDEAPPVRELFAMVDEDLEAHGLWFGPVGVGEAWVLGEEANYIPRICGIYTIDRMVLRHGRSSREMALVLIDDRFQLHRTDFYVSPQDLKAAADCIALRAPDAVRGVNDQYERLWGMDEEQQEQFLRERRRRMGSRAAAAAQSDRDSGPAQDMTLTLADGTATSRLTGGQLRETLARGLAAGEETVFFLTPSRPRPGGGETFSELEVRLRPGRDRPVELLLKAAPDRDGPPTRGYLWAFSQVRAGQLLEDWLAGRALDRGGWEPVTLLSGGRAPGGPPGDRPASLWLEGPEGRQQFDSFTGEDLDLAAEGIRAGTYTFVGYQMANGGPFFFTEAGGASDGRTLVRCGILRDGAMQVYETRMSPRQAAGALEQFRAGSLVPDRAWKNITKSFFKD